MCRPAPPRSGHRMASRLRSTTTLPLRSTSSTSNASAPPCLPSRTAAQTPCPQALLASSAPPPTELLLRAARPLRRCRGSASLDQVCLARACANLDVRARADSGAGHAASAVRA
eukprot:2683820-Rhodomonas_salina.1